MIYNPLLLKRSKAAAPQSILLSYFMSDQPYQYDRELDINLQRRSSQDSHALTHTPNAGHPSLPGFGPSMIHGPISSSPHQGLDSSFAIANQPQNMILHGNQFVASRADARSRSSSYSRSHTLPSNQFSAPGTPSMPAFRSSPYGIVEGAPSNAFPSMTPLGSHQGTLSTGSLSSDISLPTNHGQPWPTTTPYLSNRLPTGSTNTYPTGSGGGLPAQSWSGMVYSELEGHRGGNLQLNQLPSFPPQGRTSIPNLSSTSAGIQGSDYPYASQEHATSPIHRLDAHSSGNLRIINPSTMRESGNVLPLPLSYPSPSLSSASEGTSVSSSYFVPRAPSTQLPLRHDSFSPSALGLPPTQELTPVQLGTPLSRRSSGSERLPGTDPLTQSGREWTEWRDTSSRNQSGRLMSAVGSPESGPSLSTGYGSSFPSPFTTTDLRLSPSIDDRARSSPSLKRPLEQEQHSVPEPPPNRRRYKTHKSGASSDIPHLHALNIVCNHPRCLLSASGAISLDPEDPSAGGAKRSGKKKLKDKEKTHSYECSYVEPSTGVPCDSKFKRRGCRDRHSSSHSGKESKDVSASCLTLGLARRLLWETCRLIEEKDWACLFLTHPATTAEKTITNSPTFEQSKAHRTQHNYAEATRKVQEEFDIDVLTYQAAAVRESLKAAPFSNHHASGAQLTPVPLVDLSSYHQFSRMAMKRAKSFERYFCTDPGCEVDFTRLDALLRHSRTCHNPKKKGKRHEVSREEELGSEEASDEEESE
ncbi:hypothetical protein FRC02_001098 [Tulasnella sp. 418]|nr:hypothetical protein FRC02_001098 [Tulasnella sp. 418]